MQPHKSKDDDLGLDGRAELDGLLPPIKSMVAVTLQFPITMFFYLRRVSDDSELKCILHSEHKLMKYRYFLNLFIAG